MLKKGIAVSVLFFFVSTSLSPVPALSYAEPSPAPQAPRTSSPFPGFSEDLARLEEESVGEVSKTPVIFLQDAHVSFDAQEKISQLIQEWVSQGKVERVFAEGNRGPMDVRELFKPVVIARSEIPPMSSRAPEGRGDLMVGTGSAISSVISPEQQAIIRKVSNDFIHSMEFGAVEDAHAVSEKPFHLEGLEDLDAYENNLAAFKKTMEIPADLDTILKLLDKGFRELESNFFTGDALELWRKILDFREGKLSLEDYLIYLAEKKTREGSPLENRPSLQDRDRSLYLRPVPNASLEGVSSDLQTLFSLIDPKHPLKPKELKEKVESIKTENLMRELEEYSDQLLSSVILSDSEGSRASSAPQPLNPAVSSKDGSSPLKVSYSDGGKGRTDVDQFINLYHRLSLITKLRRLELSSEEWQLVNTDRSFYHGKVFWDFLREHRAKVKEPSFSKQLEDYLAPAFKFYEIAVLRDQKMFDNLGTVLAGYQGQVSGRDLSLSRERTVPAALTPVVLVAGGFHRTGFVDRLKKAGHSVRVLSPKITSFDKDAETLYVKRMTSAAKPKMLDYFWVKGPQGWYQDARLKENARNRIAAKIQTVTPLKLRHGSETVPAGGSAAQRSSPLGVPAGGSAAQRSSPLGVPAGGSWVKGSTGVPTTPVRASEPPSLVAGQSLGHEEDFNQRYAEKYRDREPLVTPVLGNRRIYDAVAALFGVDEPTEKEREVEAKRLLQLLYSQSNKEELLSKAIQHLDTYTYLASGANRYMPIFLAVRNHLEGRSLFSPQGLQDVRETMSRSSGKEQKLLIAELQRFSEENLLYPSRVEGIRRTSYFPTTLLLPRSERGPPRILDIGTAFKTGGAPGLNLGSVILKDAHPELIGTDIFFPLFEENNSRITVLENFKITDRRGIQYHDASRDPKANIMNDAFNLGRFDYISIIATLHHLKYPGEKWQLLPLADFGKVKNDAEGYRFVLKSHSGEEVSFDHSYYITENQQKAISRLLGSLKDRGILFLNFAPFWARREIGDDHTKLVQDARWRQHNLEESNAHTFLIIQRDDAGKRFILQDDVLSYHRLDAEFNVLKGELHKYAFKNITDLYSQVPLDPGHLDYQRIRKLFEEADYLVFAYQKINRSRVGSLSRAAMEMTRQTSLTPADRQGIAAVIRAYLEHVPDSEPLKTQLIQDAKMIDQELKGASLGEENAKKFNELYLQKYPKKGSLFSESFKYRSVYEGITALFGKDVADSDRKRDAEGERLLQLIFAQGMEDQVLEHFHSFSYTASGVHRFYPVALVISNILKERSIFSTQAFEEASPEMKKYFDNTLPNLQDYFARADNAAPGFVLPKPDADKPIRWLDIGSAPKENGAPTLNFLKEYFEGILKEKKNIELSGVDIFFPVFKEKDGKIGPNEDFQFSESGRAIVNLVTYYNALKDPKADVMNKQGLDLGKFDFISMCATLHHMRNRPGENNDHDFKLISGKKIKYFKNGSEAGDFKHEYRITKTQQEIVDNMLDSLKVGGTLFLNFTYAYLLPKDVPDAKAIYLDGFVNSSNTDAFLIIHRQSEDQFAIYDELIPFRPGADAPNTAKMLIGPFSGLGFEIPDLDEVYPALKTEEGEKLPPEIEKLIKDADRLVFKYQSLDNTFWGQVFKAGLEKRQGLPKMMEKYLANVSAGGADDALKAKLLSRARNLDSQLKAIGASLGKDAVVEDYRAKLEPLTKIPWEKLPRGTRDILSQFGVTPDLVELGQASGKSAEYLFKDGLRALKQTFTSEELKAYWPDLVEIGKASGENAVFLFKYALPALKDLIKTPQDLKQIGQDLIELGKASGNYAWSLFKNGFPAVKDLIKTPQDLKRIGQDLVELGKARGWKADYLFKGGLSALKQTFTPEEFKTYWPDLVELGKASGEHARDLFEYGLPAVKDLIKNSQDLKQIGQDLVELGKASGEYARGLFKEGLPVLKQTFTPEELKAYWPDLIGLAEASSYNVVPLFRDALPALKQTFTPEEFKSYWPDLVELGKASGGRAMYLFKDGLSALKQTFTPEEFKTYWPDLVELGKASGEHARDLFEYGLPAVKDLIKNSQDLKQIGQDLVELGKARGGDAGFLFRYGLPALKRTFTPEELKTYWPDLVELGKASGEHAASLFHTGFHALKQTFTPEEFKTYWPDLVELGKADGGHAGILFHFGLPALKDLIKTPQDLKQIGQDLAELHKTWGERTGLLFQYGLPAVKGLIKNSQDLKQIGQDLEELSKASGWKAEYLFEDGLPTLKRIFTPEELKAYWPGLVELGKASGEHARDLFKNGLSALKQTFTPAELKTYWPGLVELGKASGGNAWSLFSISLPALKQTFTPEEFKSYWPDLVELGKADGGHAGILFHYGLPAVKDLIKTPQDLKQIGQDLVELSKASGGNAFFLFHTGLPALKRTFTSEELNAYWPDLVEIGKASGKHAEYLFRNTLPALKDLIKTPQDLKQIGQDLVELGQVNGENAWVLFQDGLPAVKDLIKTREDLKQISQDLVELVKASGGSKNAWTLFKYGLPAVKDFIKTRQDLKQIGQDLVELSKASGEHFRVLFELGLPALKDLIKTPQDLKQIGQGLAELGKASGKNTEYLFKEGIPTLKQTFTPEEFKTYWPGLVELGKASGENAVLLFKYALPALKDLIKTPQDLKQIGQDLVGLSKASGEWKNAWILFGDALPALKDLIKTSQDLKQIGQDLIELGKASGDHAGFLFRHDLPDLKRTFTPEEFKTYWPGLVELGKASGEHAWYLFEYGLPDLKRTFTPEEFKTYWPDLVELGKASGGRADYLFRKGLPDLKGTFTTEEFKAYWPDLVELGKASGENAGVLFAYGLPAVKDLIKNSQELKQIGQDLVELGKASGEHAGDLFEHGLPGVKHLIHSHDDLKWIGDQLLALDPAGTDWSGESSIYQGLYLLQHLIRSSEDIKSLAAQLIQFNQEMSGTDLPVFFYPGVYALRSLIRSAEDLNEIAPYLIKLHKLRSKEVNFYYTVLIPGLEDLLGEELRAYLPRIVERAEKGEIPRGDLELEKDFDKRYRDEYPKAQPLFDPNAKGNQYQGVYEALATLFGIDKGNDKERWKTGEERLRLIYDWELVEFAIDCLPTFTFTASGEHRFYPLALAVSNYLKGDSFFSPNPIPGLIEFDPKMEYLKDLDLLYTGPNLSDLPVLKLLKPPQKASYRWLDIGSAPKEEGAPTLNFIKKYFKDYLKVESEVVGTDTLYPILELNKEGRLGRNKRFQSFDEAGKVSYGVKKGYEVDYYDARLRKSKANIMDSGFDLGRFDFISIAMALHHLYRRGEDRTPKTLTTLTLSYNKNGKDQGLYEEPYSITVTQQAVIDRLLRSLNVGGILFLNLTYAFKLHQDDPDKSRVEQEGFRDRSNADLFLVIQREAEDRYVIHDEAVPFRPNSDSVNTAPKILDVFKSEFESRPDLKKKFTDIWKRADELAYKWQRINRSIWGWAMQAVETKKKNPEARLPEMMKIYLQAVPDTHPLKVQLLQEMNELDRVLGASLGLALSGVEGTAEEAIEALQLLNIVGRNPRVETWNFSKEGNRLVVNYINGFSRDFNLETAQQVESSEIPPSQLRSPLNGFSSMRVPDHFSSFNEQGEITTVYPSLLRPDFASEFELPQRGGTSGFQLSPNQELLLVQYYRQISRIYDLKTKVDLRPLIGHITGVDISPDGKFLVIRSDGDGAVKIFNLKAFKDNPLLQEVSKALGNDAFYGFDILSLLNRNGLIHNAADIHSYLSLIQQFKDIRTFRTAFVQLLFLNSNDDKKIDLFPKYGSLDDVKRILQGPDEATIIRQLGQYAEQIQANYAREVREGKDLRPKTQDQRPEEEKPKDELWLKKSATDDQPPATDVSGQSLGAAKEAFETLRLLALAGVDRKIDHYNFSPNGSLIAVTYTEGSPRVFNLKSRQEIVLPLGPEVSRVITFASDSKLVAVAYANGSTRLFNVDTKQDLGLPISPKRWSGPEAIRFSSDSHWFSIQYADMSTEVFDLTTGMNLESLIGPKINRVNFSPDGKLLFVRYLDGTAKIYDLQAKKDLEISFGTDVFNAGFSPDSNFALIYYSSDGPRPKIFDLKTKEGFEVPSRYLTPNIHCPYYQKSPPEGSVLFIDYGISPPELFNLKKEVDLKSLIGETDIRRLDFSSNQRYLFVHYKNARSKVFDLETKKEIELPIERDHTWVQFSPDDKYLLVSLQTVSYVRKESFQLFDLENRREIKIPLNFTTGDFGWVPNSDLLWVRHPGLDLLSPVEVFDIKTQLPGRFPFGSRLDNFSFSSDGKWLAARYHRTAPLRVYDLDSFHRNSLLKDISTHLGEQAGDGFNLLSILIHIGLIQSPDDLSNSYRHNLNRLGNVQRVSDALTSLFFLTSQDAKKMNLFPKYGSLDEVKRILEGPDEETIVRQLGQYREQIVARYQRDEKEKIPEAEQGPPEEGGLWLTKGKSLGTAEEAIKALSLLTLSGGKEIKEINFSEDGSHVIVSYQDKSARVFNVKAERGKEDLKPLIGSNVKHVFFSANDSLLVVDYKTAPLRVFNLRAEKGKEDLGPLLGSNLEYVSVSPDSSLLVVTRQDKSAHLFNLKAEKGNEEIALPLGVFMKARFSPDSSLLMVIDPQIASRIFNLKAEKGKEDLEPLIGPDVRIADFSPDGGLLTVSYKNDLTRVFNLKTEKGKEDLEPLIGPKVKSTSSSPDSSFLTVKYQDESARVFNLKAEKGKEDLAPLIGRDVKDVTFSPDSNLFFVKYRDDSSKLFNLKAEEGKEDFKLATGSNISKAHFSPDSSFLFADHQFPDNAVRIFDLRAGKEMENFKPRIGSKISHVFLSPDNSLLYVHYQDGPAHVFNLKAEMGNEDLNLPIGPEVDFAEFSPDSSLLVVTYQNRTARVFNLKAEKGKEDLELPIGNWIREAYFSTDGSLVIVIDRDGSARFLDVKAFTGNKEFKKISETFKDQSVSAFSILSLLTHLGLVQTKKVLKSYTELLKRLQNLSAVNNALSQLLFLLSEDNKNIELFPKYASPDDLKRIFENPDEATIVRQLGQYAEQIESNYAREQKEKTPEAGRAPPEEGGLWLTKGKSLGEGDAEMTLDELLDHLNQQHGSEYLANANRSHLAEALDKLLDKGISPKDAVKLIDPLLNALQFSSIYREFRGEDDYSLDESSESPFAHSLPVMIDVPEKLAKPLIKIMPQLDDSQMSKLSEHVVKILEESMPSSSQSSYYDALPRISALINIENEILTRIRVDESPAISMLLLDMSEKILEFLWAPDDETSLKSLEAIVEALATILSKGQPEKRTLVVHPLKELFTAPLAGGNNLMADYGSFNEMKRILQGPDEETIIRQLGQYAEQIQSNYAREQKEKLPEAGRAPPEEGGLWLTTGKSLGTEADYKAKLAPLIRSDWAELPMETRDILHEFGVTDDVVKFAKASGVNAGYIFRFGLPALKETFTFQELRIYWSSLVALGKATGAHDQYVFSKSIPILRITFPSEELGIYLPGIVELAKARTENVRHWLEWSIPKLKEAFAPEGVPDELKAYWPDFVGLGKISGNGPGYLLGTALPGLREVFGPKKFKEYWPDLKELLETNGISDEDLSAITRGVQLVKDIIKSREDIGRIDQAFQALGDHALDGFYILSTLIQIGVIQDGKSFQTYVSLLTKSNGIPALRKTMDFLNQRGSPEVIKQFFLSFASGEITEDALLLKLTQYAEQIQANYAREQKEKTPEAERAPPSEKPGEELWFEPSSPPPSPAGGEGVKGASLGSKKELPAGYSLGDRGEGDAGLKAAQAIVESKEKLNLIYFLETVTTARVKGQLKFTGRTEELIQPLIRSLENPAHQVIFVSDDLAKLQNFTQALNGLALPKNIRNQILVTSGSLKTQKDFLKFQKLEGKTAFVAPQGALDQVVNFSSSEKTNWEIFVAQDELEGGSYGQLAADKLQLKDAYLFAFTLSELAKERRLKKEIQYPSFSFFLSEAIQAWMEGFLAREAVAKAA